jgi:hypothetical protein
MHEDPQHKSRFHHCNQQCYKDRHGTKVNAGEGNGNQCQGYKNSQNNQYRPVWYNMSISVLVFHILSGDKIKQGEKEYPYKIHKVPVEAAVFLEDKVVMGDLVPYDIRQHKAYKYKPYNDMQGMNSRHEVV